METQVKISITTIELGLSLSAIGIDCLYIPRMRALLERRPDFFKKLCREEELDQHPPSLEKALYLWTAKEAVAKALKTGVWQSGIDWQDLMILEGNRVKLHGEAQKLAENHQITLSFEIIDDYAFAKAVLWKKGSA
jgi:phosphopantetheine--protein transferase-like protein